MDFAGIVPKGSHATVIFLGTVISEDVLAAFLDAPEVKRCMPPGWEADQFVCRCAPRMAVGAAVQPFADRMVFVGDSGVSRLYKDGIGAAYRTAKAAARTAVFYGIAGEDFRDHFWPTCQAIVEDNRLGKVVFAFTRQIQHRRFARRALLQMVIREQQQPDSRRRMSSVLWDTFTGSAPYRDIFWRTLHPAHLSGLLQHVLGSTLRGGEAEAGALIWQPGSAE